MGVSIKSPYPKYPEYKDSSVEWLGEVPNGWSVRRAKRFFQEIVVRGHTGERLLSATQSSGVVPREDAEMRVWNPGDDVSSYKLVLPGDFVISLRSFQGGLEISRVRGIVSPAYTVLRPRGVNRDYLRHLLKAEEFIAELNIVTTGIRQGKNIAFRDFAELKLPIPPSGSQRVIAAFLDRETAKIDTLIAKKEKLIELLAEQRTALITQAVTKGLDPTVPMKDSGVEWLGEVPEHWEVAGWRRVCRIEDGLIDPKETDAADQVLIAPNHVESGTGKVLALETAYEQGAISGKYRAPAGTLIYSKIRPALKKACISLGDWLCSADMYPIRPDLKQIAVQYLLLYVLSDPFVRLTIDESMRVAMPKINREALGRIPVVVPPIEEQAFIVKQVQRETARIDTLTDKIYEAIDRLKEYRTALISAAVTGKIDVRDAA